MILDRTTTAYRYLRNGIITGEFPEGSPIREMDVAESLQISRSPVREAIRLLEREGVLTIYPARGAFVNTLTPHDVEEICELRILHELYALEKAIKKITVEDLEKIEAAFRITYERRDWDSYHQVDYDFHDLIVRKCGSPRLLNFICTLNFQIERLRRYMAQNPHRMEESFREHLQIIKYIRLCELQMAKLEMEKHLREVMFSYLETHKFISSECNS